MTQMTPFEGYLRLTTVRFKSDNVAICGAMLMDENGGVVPGHEAHSVKFPLDALCVEPRVGQQWFVRGKQGRRVLTRGHHAVTEVQVTARSAELNRPSGEHIIEFLSKSEDFPGVGEVTARRLWDAFGQDLYETLDCGDEQSIAEVIGSQLATVVIEGWRLFDASEGLAWLHRMNIAPRISRSLLEIYGPEVKQRLEEDPYRAIAFGMSWQASDQLGTKVFGLSMEDPRRLTAAVECCLYACLAEGHTAQSTEEVTRMVGRLIGAAMAPTAVTHAIASGVAMETGDGLLTSPGLEVIERQIAEFMHGAGNEPPLCSDAEAEAVIRLYEKSVAASSGEPFGLNDAQRAAVLGVARSAGMLLTGGAGVGKTTVLRGIVALLDHLKFPYRVMTISGRAARRAAEATGQSTSTIAGYLRKAEGAPSIEQEPLAVIVDEASMLDVLLAWRIIQTLPAKSRLILIGDPAQLPPVGPGLTLHAMVDTSIPNVELTQARRFGGEIAAFSREIREGRMPEPESSGDANSPVRLLPLPTHQLIGEAVDSYLKDPDRTQILAFTREGAVSCAAINDAVQRALVGGSHSLSADESRVGIKVENEDGMMEYTGLRRLDRVICNVNLHDEGLNNGSLGQITEVFAPPRKRSAVEACASEQADELVYGLVAWDDDVVRPLTLPVLDALELAYCITTHKSQGSQFERVVIACSDSRLLDRAIVYTAVTRASKQVVLMGDVEAARRAVAKPPKASSRITTLASRLASIAA